MHDTGDHQPLTDPDDTLQRDASAHAAPFPAARTGGAPPDCAPLLRLELIQELAACGDWEFDASRGTLTCSPAMLRLLRREPAAGQPTFREFLESYPETDAGRLRHALGLILSGSEQVQVELWPRFSGGFPVRQRCTLLPGTAVLAGSGSIFGMIQELDRQHGTPQERRDRDRIRECGSGVTGPADSLQFRIAVPAGTCEYISPSVLEMTGIPPRDWYQQPTLLRDLLFPAWQTRFERTYRRLLSDEGRRSHTFPILHRQGGIRWFALQVQGRRNHAGQLVALEGSALDITQRKQQERKRRQLLRTLHRTLTATKSPEDVIPICSHCKKVRDNRGFWKKIEQFLAEQGELLFSHGICPDCLTRHYPDFPQHPAPSEPPEPERTRT